MEDEEIGLLILIGLIALVWWLRTSGWHSEFRYVVQYQTSFDMVEVDKKPHDCDFLSAPLGRKHCRYKARVSVAHHGVDKDVPREVISFDRGKTWHWNDGGPKRGVSVHVAWERK